jgi:hypothetical protein
MPRDPTSRAGSEGTFFVLVTYTAFLTVCFELCDDEVYIGSVSTALCWLILVPVIYLLFLFH